MLLGRGAGRGSSMCPKTQQVGETFGYDFYLCLLQLMMVSER